MIERLGTRVVALIVLGLCIGALAWWGWHQWQNAVQGAAAARVERNQGRALSDSARDAISAAGASQRKTEAIDNSVKGTRDEIDRATDARGIDAAGRRGLCRIPAHIGKPPCVQQPDPR